MSGTITTGRGAVANTGALYLAVFLVSLGVLLLQIALTRIFSFTLWYHFAYVTISVALLGYGASGSLLAVAPGLPGASATARLPWLALGCAVAIVVGLATFATLPFHPFTLVRFLQQRQWGSDGMQFLYLPVFYVAVTAPFFLAGLCISIALRTLSEEVSRLYFFDLLGAGVGCLVVVFVINALGTPAAVVVAAGVVGLSAVLFAVADGGRHVGATILGLVGVIVLGSVTVATVEFEASPEKFVSIYLADVENTRRFSQRWTAIFRTDSFGFKNEELSRTGSYASWGISPHWKEKAATQGPKLRVITHDGDAGAVIYNFDGDLAKLEIFDHLILKTPYLLLDRPNVLVIGVGGGTDIVNAVKHRARHVTGVELDPTTVDIVRVEQAEFAGHLYDRPDVTVVAGEGRSTLRHSDERYDLIQMTGVDTLAALSTGAYVLSESYLYTTEAVHEFLDHLSPNGVLSYTVADFNGRNAFPRHTMRLLSLFLQTLEERGVTDGAERIAIVASTEPVPQVSMLLKNAPFSAAERQRLLTFTDEMGFKIWALPGRTDATTHSQYIHTPASERAAFRATLPLVMTPTSDDNPFFFNFYTWGSLGRYRNDVDFGHTLATGQIVLVMMLVLALALSLVLILGPLVVFQRQGLSTDGKWGFIVFFIAIGLGFILIEISLVQKFVLFLGYPTYSLTIVLCALLTASGCGSFLTGRMTRQPEQRFTGLFIALALISAAYVALLPRIFHAFLGSPFALRVAIASVALLPLGLVMGMFFPSGIQLVRKANAQFVPWAWAINGCASVVGTVLAVMLAMSYGFRFVTALALVIYFVGIVGIRASAAQLAKSGPAGLS